MPAFIERGVLPMSDEGSKNKRPESFDDLEEYQRFDTIVSLTLTDELLGSGAASLIVARVEELAVELRRVYADAIELKCERAELKVRRRKADAELVGPLRWAQDYWDRQYASEGSASVKAGA